MSAVCDGMGPEHCCWAEGEWCPWLVENGPDGRRWSCGLLAELGHWDMVHQDRRYLRWPKPAWERAGITVDCGDWPPPGTYCGSCDRTG